MSNQTLAISALAIVFAVTVFVVAKKVEADRNYEHYAGYCGVRAELAMGIFDSIKDGLPLNRIHAFWRTPPKNIAHSLDREQWWEELKIEVDTLMKEGKLSMRVKEIVLKECLKRNPDGLMVREEDIGYEING